MNDNARLFRDLFLVATKEATSASLPDRTLRVEKIPGSLESFAGADTQGRWHFVIATQGSESAIPSLRLRHLSVDYGVEYQLNLNGCKEARRVSVIRCETSDDSIHAMYSVFCAAVHDSLPSQPTETQLEHEIDKWHSLFWRLQTPPKRSVVGLIGELTLLDCVASKRDWVRAWHTSSNDSIDFVFADPSLSVEVKATTGPQRVHSISLHQAMPILDDTHFFASVLVELRDSGSCIREVIEDISNELVGTPELHRFWEIMSEICGEALEEYGESRYLRESAKISLQLYRSKMVPQPKVETPLPAGVSWVRFQSDFSSSESVPPAQIFSFS